MNKVIRTSSILHLEAICSHPFHLKPSFFHSTPILERRRRNTCADSRFTHYHNRRSGNGKQKLMRSVSAFAEELFQSWRDEHEENQPSWFRREFGPGRNRGRSTSRGPKPGSGRRFEFCEDDGIDVEHVFRATFGGNKHFYWSFTSEEPEREYTSSYNTRNRRNWRHKFDDEYDSDDSNGSTALLSSYRLTLGLKASGPLHLEDVKTAYRACALKWHPDRHQGSSKVVAEEKFKKCSAAYQSLCDQLVVN